jgi:hypothetical protein
VAQKSILVDWVIPDPGVVADWKRKHLVEPDDPRVRTEL